MNIEGKKQYIIKESARLFYYNGYKNTSVDDILKLCKIPKGSFYYYFSSKDDLLFQVIDFHTNNMINFFNKTVTELNIDKLKNFFCLYFDNINKNNYHGGSPLGNLISELADINEEARIKLDNSYTLIEKRILYFIEILIKTNSNYKNMNANTITKTLLSNFEGTLLLSKLKRNEKSIDIFLKFFDNIFI